MLRALADNLSPEMNTLALLTALRDKAKLSEMKLAELLGTSRVSVSRWQRGMGEPSPSQTQRLVELYGSMLEGHTPTVHTSNLFSSRGVRGRAPGQGILGESLAFVELQGQKQAPIISRLMNEGVFNDNGNLAIQQLLELHSAPCPTVKTPLTRGISAGKNTYTYDAHTYHTKVPPQGISELLSYYLPQGGLVLDPFSGSGMTGVAASVTGHDCILNELSPAACFISNRFTTSHSPTHFEAAVSAVLARLRSLRTQLYSTECRECGRSTEILYTVWSYKVICKDCGHEFRLWDHCKKFGKTVREHKILSEFPCPSCHTVQHKSLLRRTTAVPVLVGYKCCGSRQQEAMHAPSVKDLQRIEALESSAPLVEGFYPVKDLPDGVNLRQPARHGLNKIEKFYTRRNLSALSHIWETIHHIESPQLAGHLAFVFTSLYQRVTRLSEFRFWGGSGNRGCPADS